MTTPSLVTSRQNFEEALENAIAPWVVDKFKHPGAVVYRVMIEGEEFYLLTGLSAIPATTVQEYFFRYIAVLETLFELEPNTWRTSRVRDAPIVRLLVHQLVIQTNLMRVKDFWVRVAKEGSSYSYYSKIRSAYKTLKRRKPDHVLDAAVEITKRYFYDHFKIYHENSDLRANSIRLCRGKVIPDGVHIGIDRRQIPTFPVSSGRPRSRDNDKRRNRSHPKLPGFSF